MAARIDFEANRHFYVIEGRRKRPATACCLYLMERRDGVIKIGISGEPEKRLSTIRTSSPDPIRLAHSWVLETRPQALKAEGMLHQWFKPRRAAREWFSIEAREARSVAELMLRKDPAEAKALAELLYQRAKLVRDLDGLYNKTKSHWRHRAKHDGLSEAIEAAEAEYKSLNTTCIAAGLEPDEIDHFAASMSGDQPPTAIG